ncbi:MAG: TIGR00300 family protein [Cyanobacteria bacterium P01_A01_bin.114]
MSAAIRFLMCAPSHYDVDYVINPWMEGNIHRSSKDLAKEQWQGLANLLANHADVEQVEPQLGWPDMVFTANAGLVLGDNVVLSRFLHPERQGEEPHFKAWFERQGYTVHELPEDLPFEGAGDALFDREGRMLWAGYGFRTELASHGYVAQWLDVEVLSLRLMDERFYHLDTCFCPLADGYLLYYPAAFDAYSNHLIEMRVPADKRIAVEEDDAVNFACNAVNIDRIIVMNKASQALKQRLADIGFDVKETPLTEFLKAGGAAKCLTLRVTEPVRPELHAAPATLESRTVALEGHLLDSGLINRALDVIVEAGGSFQVLSFDLGTQRQSTSSAQVRVSAPDRKVMEDIMSQLIDLGALHLPDQVCDAQLKAAEQAGVAPHDFYSTTIYPTEVRVQGAWVRVQNQRMDGVVVVNPTSEGPVADCRLIRDLQVGESAVVGVDGIRTVRKQVRDRKTEEFSFMGAGVSSERRVELIVEQVAWEMRKLRDQGGRIVVVPGPVVVHTGGVGHLSHLIREGYIQALLGGNAIAVHDIEQALMGTSLGVDMQRGVSVQGGHRHHLKAINAIRRCGSIAQAVEQGVLTRGIFYEAVRHGVEFSLAGSIRDDGPLPDTQMDLIQAQTDYARLIKGADMILMLSTMLHSIGVGNMTPAGVKMVCVDINPAVVTKLSDRGSIESTGVVTDVGLFLSLLVSQLERLNRPYALTPAR